MAGILSGKGAGKGVAAVSNHQPDLLDYYKEALGQFGPGNWWPADSPFEVMVGAILTQNSSWKNVEKAIKQLKQSEVLSPSAMVAIDQEHLEELIRPSGYYRQKARKLRELLHWLSGHQFQLDRIKKIPWPKIREELLQIWGVGPETADSILLYALEKPVFVVDRYTYRVACRHGWFGMSCAQSYNNQLYHWLQHQMMSAMNQGQRAEINALLFYNDFHAQIVRIGNGFCKPDPRCQGCPWDCFPRG